jgi:hypothetical protein
MSAHYSGMWMIGMTAGPKSSGTQGWEIYLAASWYFTLHLSI